MSAAAGSGGPDGTALLELQDVQAYYGLAHVLQGVNLCVTKLVTGSVSTPNINQMDSYEFLRNVFASDFQVGSVSVPITIVWWLFFVAVSGWVLQRTRTGNWIYAVGGNMQAARLTGIKVWLVLLFVYGMSGLLSGLGGVMSASRLYSANGNLGTGYELDAIAAVILGGTSFVGGIGTITGTLVGALIIATLNNGMTLMGVSYFWQLVIKGAVIIIAVLIDKYRTRHHQSA